LQERIMTQPYGKEEVYFKNSAYLVLNNRLIAILIAVAIMKYRNEPLRNQAPILKCAGVSVSNTIATFCQYDALKYVSFPTQTLGQCGKMIPVMILGMLIGGRKYTWKDFIVAIIVTIGCLLFVLTGNISDNHRNGADSFYGLLLMGGYLFADGFTSTFQEKLFRGYEMSTYNQMLYVNLCSGIFSLITLLVSNELVNAINFSITYPDFLFNSLLLSVASTCGQLVILLTIKEFGALFFATVMTIRQVISIILSCIIYFHPLTIGQWLSSVIVFGSLYYKDTMMRKSRGHGHGHGPLHLPGEVKKVGPEEEGKVDVVIAEAQKKDHEVK